MMQPLRPAITSFTAGELSPKMLGRVDFQKYQYGCKTMENFFPWPQGMASFRPGTRYIAGVKTHSKKVRLIPFEYSTTQAYVLEFGDQYIRFYMNQGQIVTTGPYEISSPYLEADLWKIAYIQSADVLYLACPGYQPRKLTRTGHTNWTLSVIVFEDGPYLSEDPDLNIGLKPASKTGTGINLDAKTLGPEKVKNGSFDYSPDPYWTIGSSWVVNNNRLEHMPGTSNSCTQDIGITIDKTYLITFTLGGTTASGLNMTCGGQTILSAEQNTGRYTKEFTATSTAELSIGPSGSSFNGWIDNISVREITGTASLFNANMVGAFFRLQHRGKWGNCKVVSYVSVSQVTVDIITTEDGTDGFGDTTTTACWREGAWSTHRGWPSLVTFFEDRLFWAATTSKPQTLWGSQTGDYENHAPDKNQVVTDSCAVAYTVNADQVNALKWLIPGKVLLAGASRGQWQIGSADSNEPISPGNIMAKRVTNLTSSSVAITADHTVIFWQIFGRRMMEMVYSMQDDAYVAADLSIMSDHMGSSIVKEMCYKQEPASTLWAVRTDGQLVSITYERQHQVVGWARHVTDGAIESVATISGATRDEIWLVVKRTISGATKRYVELLENLESYEATDPKDVFYVDCGLTYSGSSTQTITGLSHLEGKTVAVFADGRPQTNKTVTSGQINLDTAASKVQVGLPYTGTLIPVELEMQVREGTAQGRVRRVAQIVLRLYKSHQGKLGRDLSHLDSVPHATETGPLSLFSGDKRVIFGGDFDRNLQLALVQDKPMPMNVLALFPVLATE